MNSTLSWVPPAADSASPAAAEPINADRLRQSGALRELASAAAFLKDRQADAKRQLEEAAASAGQAAALHSMELSTLGVVQARLAHLLQRCSLALGSDGGADRSHLSKNVSGSALICRRPLHSLD